MIELPQPTEFELKPFNKWYYWLRLVPMNLEKKYNVPIERIYGWIHENYDSILLEGKPLKFKK